MMMVMFLPSNKREQPEDVCATRVTSSRSLRAYTRSEESIRTISGSEDAIRPYLIHKQSFVFSAGAEA